MKLAFITPTKYINSIGKKGKFNLVLSHLIELKKETEYEKEIKKSKLPILMDNGLFENHVADNTKDLILKAKKLNAECFFAPDVLYNSKKTKKELNKTVKLAKKLKYKGKIGAVVQANSRGDYWKQLIEFNENNNVDLIGLSILSIPKSYRMPITESRLELLKKMLEYTLLTGYNWKSMHLLGIGDSYEDVIFANKYCYWIQSNDSSCVFQSGLFNKKLNKKGEVPGGKVKEKVNFNLKEITKKQEDLINENIKIIKRLVE